MNKEKSWKDLYDSNQNTGNAKAIIELSLSARNLINLDLVCITYLKKNKIN